MTSDRFFFDQDCSSHWYMVPVSLRPLWDTFTQDDIPDDDYEAQARFSELFDEYRIDGGPTSYTFCDPDNQDPS